jgi:hypothetical protein
MGDEQPGQLCISWLGLTRVQQGDQPVQPAVPSTELMCCMWFAQHNSKSVHTQKVWQTHLAVHMCSAMGNYLLQL